MIEGLKLTVSGEELRGLLKERIDHHGRCAEHWTHETTRTPEDATEDAPLLPEHMCTNEAERHTWRADVLQFIRDHLEPAETYRLSAADLEFGELLPSRPSGLEQDEYEERTSVARTLERITKAFDKLVYAAEEILWKYRSQEAADNQAPGVIEDNDEFRSTRLDLGGDGPEIIMIERK